MRSKILQKILDKISVKKHIRYFNCYAKYNYCIDWQYWGFGISGGKTPYHIDFKINFSLEIGPLSIWINFIKK
jgi:hypothetical protein